MNEAIDDEECLLAKDVEMLGEEISIVVLTQELEKREHELQDEEPDIRLTVCPERNRIPPVWLRHYDIN